MNKTTTIRGFVALASTLIMSLILTTATAALLYTSAQTRFGVESTEYKESTRTLARACIDEALAQLVSSTSYYGDATTTSAAGTCYVYPFTRDSGDTILMLTVRTIVSTAQTTLEATITFNDLQMAAIPANSGRLGTETPTFTITNIREVSNY